MEITGFAKCGFANIDRKNGCCHLTISTETSHWSVEDFNCCGSNVSLPENVLDMYYLANTSNVTVHMELILTFNVVAN